MRLILAAGTTETALIDGISAAGATPALMNYTPAADAEILIYGEPASAPVTPVSPTGCPTPAAVTRAVREAVGLPVTVLDAGIAEPTAAPTVDLDTTPGGDIRTAEPVPDAAEIFERARTFGSALPDTDILVGETIPGGTTTALGVFRALGEPIGVSSSLPANPLERKQAVVAEALASSGLEAGDCAGEPLAAVRQLGDPVLAAVAGVTTGALESGIRVRLAGGTQLLAAAALVRHGADAGFGEGESEIGPSSPLELATTSFVAADQGEALEAAADRLGLSLTVTDPGFDRSEHVSMARYCAGEGKEGVGMGGALSIVPGGEDGFGAADGDGFETGTAAVDGSGVVTEDTLEATAKDRFRAVRAQLEAVCDRLGIDGSSGAGGHDGS